MVLTLSFLQALKSLELQLSQEQKLRLETQQCLQDMTTQTEELQGSLEKCALEIHDKEQRVLLAAERTEHLVEQIDSLQQRLVQLEGDKRELQEQNTTLKQALQEYDLEAAAMAVEKEEVSRTCGRPSPQDSERPQEGGSEDGPSLRRPRSTASSFSYLRKFQLSRSEGDQRKSSSKR